MTRRLSAVAALLSTLAITNQADAAGLYFSDRGVRPTGRGGAFVAGADDLGAIWYNPAGLADAGNSLMIDLSWLNFTSEYARRTQVTDAANTVHVYDYPQVNGTTPILPIPTLGGTYNNFADKKNLTLGFGLMAPYTAIASYPLTVGGQPSPSRYSLVSLDGSALVIVGGYLAYKVHEKFRVGGGLQMMTGSFKSTVVFSASPPDRLIGPPEDPTYDAFSQLDVGPIFAPSANLGAVYAPDKLIRLGVSGQLPFWVDSHATVKVRLPTAAPFDKATQQGEDANVKFRLPAVIRLGVEGRPMPDLRIELAYVREFWSLHDSIDITPKNIQLLGVTGFPSPFAVTPISIPRKFEDSNSIRLGVEGTLRPDPYVVDVRAGINYETSAIPRPYVAPLTIDSSKITLGVGGSLHIAQKWRLDAVGAYVMASDVVVDPAEAAVPRVNPVRGNPTAVEAINGGTYKSRATVLGVGLRYLF
jgi:long-chain fatty acid transport protein